MAEYDLDAIEAELSVIKGRAQRFADKAKEERGLAYAARQLTPRIERRIKQARETVKRQRGERARYNLS